MIIIVLLAILILLLLLIRITVHISYRFQLGTIHRLRVIVKVFSFTIRKQSFDLSKTQIARSPLNWQEFRKILSKLKVHDFHWETGVGTGEASSTGVVCGILWTGKQLITGSLRETALFKQNPVIHVYPNYEGDGFYSKLDSTVTYSIFTIRKLRKLRKN